MKPVLKFQDYDIVAKWNAPMPEIEAKVIDLWTRNNVLPRGADAPARARQAVLAVLDASGKAVAVNTAYEGHFPLAPAARDRVTCYFYRMFIEPKHRRPHLMRVMTNTAFDILERNRPKDGPQSFIIITENPGLTGPGMIRLFERFGYKVWKRMPGGKLAIRRDFGVANRIPAA